MITGAKPMIPIRPGLTFFLTSLFLCLSSLFFFLSFLSSFFCLSSFLSPLSFFLSSLSLRIPDSLSSFPPFSHTLSSTWIVPMSVSVKWCETRQWENCTLSSLLGSLIFSLTFSQFFSLSLSLSLDTLMLSSYFDTFFH